MKSILSEVQVRACAGVKVNVQAQAIVMAQVVASAPRAVLMTARLLGCQPCPRCDYIMQHCRCAKEFNNHGIDI